MIVPDAQALFAIAAVISSVSSLVWSIRRSPVAFGENHGAANAEPGRLIEPTHSGRAVAEAEEQHPDAGARHVQPHLANGAPG